MERKRLGELRPFYRRSLGVLPSMISREDKHERQIKEQRNSITLCDRSAKKLEEDLQKLEEENARLEAELATEEEDEEEEEEEEEETEGSEEEGSEEGDVYSEEEIQEESEEETENIQDELQADEEDHEILLPLNDNVAEEINAMTLIKGEEQIVEDAAEDGDGPKEDERDEANWTEAQLGQITPHISAEAESIKPQLLVVEQTTCEVQSEVVEDPIELPGLQPQTQENAKENSYTLPPL